MKKHKLVTFGLGLALILGSAEGLSYVRATIAQYDHAAPCGKLHGFPGLLQAANLLAYGNCYVDAAKGGCLQRGAVCTMSGPRTGPTQRGYCREVENANPKLDSCVCAAGQSF